MKVYCIKQGSWVGHKTGNVKMGGPKYGDICVVLGTLNFPHGDYYVLQEWLGRHFSTIQFIPLSGIDEVALFNERFKELKEESI